MEKLVDRYQHMKVAIPEWLARYDERARNEHVEMKKRQALVRSLVNMVRSNNLSWVVSKTSKFGLVIFDNAIVVIQEVAVTGGRYSGGTIFTHTLTIFAGGKEVFALTERYEGYEYDEANAMLGRLPLTDLYDLATAGERRRGALSHVCGLQGFGCPGDVCHACEGRSSYPHLVNELPY